MRRILVVAVITLSVVTLALAQDQPILLRYKFVPGQTDLYTVRATGTLPMNINPGPETGIPAMSFDTAMAVSLTTQSVCKAVSPDGSGLVEMKIPAMTVSMNVAVAQQPMDIVLKWEDG
jgi:hypothetical protein